MKRVALNSATLLSVVLCLVLLRAWQRSPWGIDAHTQRCVTAGGAAYFLASWNGGLRVVRQRVSGGGGAHTATSDRLGCWQIRYDGHVTISSRFGPQDPSRQLLGFGFEARQYTYGSTWFTTDYAVLAIPYWPLVLLAAALPALRGRRWLRVRQWELTGHCPHCGYDLRADPDRGDILVPRCPECGAAEGDDPGPLEARA